MSYHTVHHWFLC